MEGGMVQEEWLASLYMGDSWNPDHHMYIFGHAGISYIESRLARWRGPLNGKPGQTPGGIMLELIQTMKRMIKESMLDHWSVFPGLFSNQFESDVHNHQ